MKRFAPSLAVAVGLHLWVFLWAPEGFFVTHKRPKRVQPAAQLALRLEAIVRPEPARPPVPTAKPPAEHRVAPPPGVLKNGMPVQKKKALSGPVSAQRKQPVPVPAPEVMSSVDVPPPSLMRSEKMVLPEKVPTMPTALENDLPPTQEDEIPDLSVDFPSKSTVAIGQVEQPAIVEAVPLYRQNPPPVYPRVARQRRWQGTVLLEVLVSQEGLPQDIRVVASSGHEVLDRSAGKAVAGWLFAPGRRNDVPVSMLVRVPVRFELAGR